MKKKLLLTLLAIIATLTCSLSFTACSNSLNLYYLLNPDGASYAVYANHKDIETAIIPSEYKGLPVTSIDEWAFANCHKLESVTIPDSVISISNSAFNGCYKLTSIAVDANNPNYKSLNNCILSKDGTELILGCKNSLIPNSVNFIGERAFYGCSSLRSITIPDSVTFIGFNAFDNCNSLKSITIPNSVTSIGESAFYGCSSLTSVTIGNGVTSIGDYAFYECTSLTSITIGNSVTSIGENTFVNCSKLASITIPDSVTSIGFSAFYYCYKLTSITFEGTIKQWNAIEKGNGWDYYTSEYTIFCTDGEIARDGKITMY